MSHLYQVSLPLTPEGLAPGAATGAVNRARPYQHELGTDTEAFINLHLAYTPRTLGKYRKNQVLVGPLHVREVGNGELLVTLERGVGTVTECAPSGAVLRQTYLTQVPLLLRAAVDTEYQFNLRVDSGTLLMDFSQTLGQQVTHCSVRTSAKQRVHPRLTGVLQ